MQILIKIQIMEEFIENYNLFKDWLIELNNEEDGSVIPQIIIDKMIKLNIFDAF